MPNFRGKGQGMKSKIIAMLIVLLSLLQLVVPISNQELVFFSIYGASTIIFWDFYRKIRRKKESYFLFACILLFVLGLGVWKREWVIGLYQEYSKEMLLLLLIPCFTLFALLIESKIIIVMPALFLFLVFAAIKELAINKVGVAAIMYLLLFSFIEYGGVSLYGKEERKRLEGFFLLPLGICICLLALPVSQKPYPFTALKQAWKQIQEGAVSIYTEFSLFVTNRNSDFTIQFTGYSEEGIVGGSLLSSDKPALSIRMSSGPYGNLYLAGNIQNHYENNTWSFISGEDSIILEQELKIDMLELLYALYQLGYTNEITTYIKQSVATLTYQGMYTKDMFFPHKTYEFRQIEDYTSLVNKVTAFHPLKEGDSYSFRYIVPNYGSGKLEEFIKQREGVKYQEVQMDNTEFTAYIVQNYPKLREYVPKIGFEAILSGRVKQIYRDYMQIPEYMREEMGRLAKEITASAKTDYEGLQQIEAYLQEYQYTLTPPIPKKDAIKEFLLETKEGYCTYFTSAFVLLSRAAGIPARYMNGFMVPLYSEGKQEYIIESHLAHTWPEAYIEGVGWVSFEPTTGFFNYHNLPWEYQKETKKPKPESGLPDKEEIVENLELEIEQAEEISSPLIQEITFFIWQVGIGCICFFPFLVCGFGAFRLYRRKKRYQAAGNEEKVLQLFSYELLLLKGIGIGHKAEETIKQYQERVFYIKPQFEGAGLKEMFQIYMDSYYGKVHPKEEEIEKVVFCVKETEKCYQGIRKIIIVFWKCFT